LPEPEPLLSNPFVLKLLPDSALDAFQIVTHSEVSAESIGINLPALYKLCKLLPRRHPELKLTVNDLLLLYRCAYGHEYAPSAALEDALFEFRAQNTSESQKIYDMISDMLAKAQLQNPSIVIPMEATAARPRERIYPTTFRNPFTELWKIYKHTSETLEVYTNNTTQAEWLSFADSRRSLLAQLNYFGHLLRAYKKVALEGGSTSTATIKLLAYLPNSLLRILDEIPQRIDMLNEVIKGEEVFSNVGRVARGSSISRFVSAKDDNDNKTLVWAVVTDDDDTLHLALRDFRPHVAALHNIDRTDLAELIVRDYIDVFVTGFNQFVERLLEILNVNATHSSKESGA
jgi:hypothetical protein